MLYSRSPREIELNACKWWPQELKVLESQTSLIPILIDTHNQFISVITLAKSPEHIFHVLEASEFSLNIFIKHLMVLADFGGEPLQRINRDFLEYFPNKKIEFYFKGKVCEYEFKSLPVRGTLNNAKMKCDNNHILIYEPLTNLYKDLTILLMFGANSTNEEIANILFKCNIGNLIGKPKELSDFIKQRYIHVSRITGGSQANDLGNAAQTYVFEYLKNVLGDNYKVKKNGYIPGVTENGRTLTTFDIAVEHNSKYVGIEVSFQVTTNSTIERKAGQAAERFIKVSNSGNYIAYIIDGAGNFQRESALTTICSNSHCTVAFTPDEFAILLRFIKEKIG